jgi:hypothetical protein
LLAIGIGQTFKTLISVDNHECLAYDYSDTIWLSTAALERLDASSAHTKALHLHVVTSYLFTLKNSLCSRHFINIALRVCHFTIRITGVIHETVKTNHLHVVFAMNEVIEVKEKVLPRNVEHKGRVVISWENNSLIAEHDFSNFISFRRDQVMFGKVIVLDLLDIDALWKSARYDG